MDDERRELSNGGLFVRDGVIEQVGSTEELPQYADVVLDMTSQIVLPGFVNTHHHLDQTLTRALPAGQNINLFPWLRAHYPIWARRTPEASRWSALVGLAELAASGCTTVFDHAYVFPNDCRLGDDVWFAHAVHVDDDEIREFARTGAGVAHCPCSNMRLASGISPIKKYLAAGVRVGLGVDGSASNDASNILLEAREVMVLARLRIGLLPPEGPQTLLSTSDPLRRDEWMTAREALE